MLSDMGRLLSVNMTKKFVEKFLLLISLILFISGIALTAYTYIFVRTAVKFMENGEYEKAINSFRKLINWDHKLGHTKGTPVHPSLYFLIGVCYMELEEYDKAKKNLQKAIELSLLYNKKENREVLERAKIFLGYIENLESIEKK